ncbi:MAG: DUF2946 family protein [Bradyrhizobium sp.]
MPIVLIALVVQIFAPIGACWAASIAASDPLAAAVICHGNDSSGADEADQISHRAHEGCCAVCSILQTGAPVDTPQSSIALYVEPQPRRVVWVEFAAERFGARTGSLAQARAPPAIS